MSGSRLKLSPGAVLLAALVFYLGEPENVTAVLLAVLAHELGHLLMLRLLGLTIQGFRMELRGLCIEYGGYTGAVGHTLAAAAGPGAGLLYALFAAALGERLGCRWLYFSAGTSLVLTLFNLLPALPLDGGRILLSLSCALLGERRGRRLTEGCGLLIGAALLSLCVALAVSGRGLSVLLAAAWLLLYQESGQGIVKLREMI